MNKFYYLLLVVLGFVVSTESAIAKCKASDIIGGWNFYQSGVDQDNVFKAGSCNVGFYDSNNNMEVATGSGGCTMYTPNGDITQYIVNVKASVFSTCSVVIEISVSDDAEASDATPIWTLEATLNEQKNALNGLWRRHDLQVIGTTSGVRFIKYK